MRYRAINDVSTGEPIANLFYERESRVFGRGLRLGSSPNVADGRKSSRTVFELVKVSSNPLRYLRYRASILSAILPLPSFCASIERYIACSSATRELAVFVLSGSLVRPTEMQRMRVAVRDCEPGEIKHAKVLILAVLWYLRWLKSATTPRLF